jgi:hypothetical protein
MVPHLLTWLDSCSREHRALLQHAVMQGHPDCLGQVLILVSARHPGATRVTCIASPPAALLPQHTILDAGASRERRGRHGSCVLHCVTKYPAPSGHPHR